MSKNIRTIFFGIILIASMATLWSSAPVIETHASTAGEIQTKINDHSSKIQALQSEIAKYQKELDSIGTKKSTLESTIRSLTISRKKLTANLNVTKNKINSATLRLDQLDRNINKTQDNIDANSRAVASALRTIDANDAKATSPIALILNTNGLADAWTEVDHLSQFNRALGESIFELTKAKTSLSATQAKVKATKQELISLSNDQISQRKSIDANTYTKRSLLRRTKNKESSYQKLIAEKKYAEKSFERELEALQTQLKLTVHPGALPKSGSGILAWPFSKSFMNSCEKRKKVFGNLHCITQYFGNTSFATANPQIYNGHGHSGVDFGAPVGTPIHAVLMGVVLGTGNTDLAHGAKGRQCWSFGKWVMIKHPNGLNTLYAHLSEIDVSKGESVSTGHIIGYSGMTGYATGPHLHFGVYATDGTKIMTLNKFRGATTPCANATMPVATIDAYLNPLSYLPR